MPTAEFFIFLYCPMSFPPSVNNSLNEGAPRIPVNAALIDPNTVVPVAAAVISRPTDTIVIQDL